MRTNMYDDNYYVVSNYEIYNCMFEVNRVEPNSNLEKIMKMLYFRLVGKDSVKGRDDLCEYAIDKNSQLGLLLELLVERGYIVNYDNVINSSKIKRAILAAAIEEDYEKVKELVAIQKLQLIDKVKDMANSENIVKYILDHNYDIDLDSVDPIMEGRKDKLERDLELINRYELKLGKSSVNKVKKLMSMAK